jgi:hypothetical protein
MLDLMLLPTLDHALVVSGRRMLAIQIVDHLNDVASGTFAGYFDC